MTIGFLGAGKMAGAFVRGLIEAGTCRVDQIVVSDVSAAAREGLAAETGVRVVDSNAAVAAAADVVVLGVKPGDAAGAIAACGGALDGKLLISIVAGLSLAGLRALAGDGVRLVRAMPNTAAQVGRSASVLAMGSEVTEDDAERARRIFGAVGLVLTVPESQLDAVTGLSGSGPAYVFLVIEALSDGGVAAGLPRALATELAIQTVRGAAEMAARSGDHPAVLREAVTSPGGTTAAGLGVLEAAAVRSAFVEAVQAAAVRAKELG